MDPLHKQRMVGTAVLVGLAVIFVPMILDGPVEQNAAPAQSVGMPLELPPATLEPQPETPTDAEPVPVPATTPQAEPATDEGWAVQLGSFSTAANAEALARKVNDAGFNAFVQRVQVDNGTMFRVRIGPLVERDAATALAARVTRATDERAVVVPHP